MRSADSAKQPFQVEWRTVAIACLIYSSWVLVIVSSGQTPGWFTVVGLAVVIAWHGSLQHEVVHGHPFANQAANDALGSLPVTLRIPYRAYRRYHLQHHACEDLTDPVLDTESYYLSSPSWEGLSSVGRVSALAHHTLAGRMLLGPAFELAKTWRRQLGEIRRGDLELARFWLENLALLGLVGVFVFGVVGVPWWMYLAAAYLGHSLGLIRSFAEHRWAPEPGSRSAVVRSGWFFSLLFLNNNLHHTHHAEPGVAWYRLPALADRLGSEAEAAKGAGSYSGYLQVARKYGVRPVDHVLYPPQRQASETGSW